MWRSGAMNVAPPKHGTKVHTEFVLECRDLTVEYGTTRAADRVSLSVRPGQIYGLLGPNGAGKTSVIRALTTIVPVSSGSATICGHPLGRSQAVRSSIGVLPESNGYPPSQTGRSYLCFFGQLFGLDADEAGVRADRLLGDLGLADRDGRIATYSRGMRQRLGLARALINRPPLLFLDEPTLGLDPAGKAEVLEHLRCLTAEDGTAVVLCSHLLDEIDRVCDRVAIMHHGRIVEEGTVAEVIERAGISALGSIRVAIGSEERAAATLRASSHVSSIHTDDRQPGAFEVQLGPGENARSGMLRELLDARVDLRAFDHQAARLSSAFLAITGQADEVARAAGGIR